MKGICKLSCIPVRKEASSTSEMTTMLLFGETYTVIESEAGWTHIKTDADQYVGWISS
ncbi:MAG: SH3 domain-containing protein, partial [Bacteroidota bacterium]